MDWRYWMRYDVWEIVPKVVTTLKTEKLEAAIRAVKKTQIKIGLHKLKVIKEARGKGFELVAHFQDEQGCQHKLELRDAKIGKEGKGKLIPGLQIRDCTPVTCSDILIDGESTVKGIKTA